MSEENFENNLKCSFNCKYDPRSKKTIEQDFTKEMFCEFNNKWTNPIVNISADFNAHLFKLAANEQL